MLLANKETYALKRVEFEILHRWKKQYQRRVLARFYKLSAWADKHLSGTGVTLITFTTRQDIPLCEQLEFLKHNFRKLRDNMRKHLGKFEYVWVTEPHKTGYAHIHMLAFAEFRLREIRRYKHLWSDKYCAGSYAYGLDFSDYITKDSLRSVKNYLMKYVTKSIDYKCDDGTKVFNAVAWNMSRRSNTESTGFRFYGMSRNLTSICKLDKEESKYQCLEMNIVRPARIIEFPNLFLNRHGYKMYVEFPPIVSNLYRLGDVERLQTAYKNLNLNDLNISLCSQSIGQN